MQVVLTGVTSHVSTVAGGTQTVDLQSQETIPHIDYGISFQDTQWHNTRIAEDVNDDGIVSAIDVLLIINLLNANTPAALIGSSIPATPYIDVSNDAFLTAIDALLVINAINTDGQSEGEANFMASGGSTAAEGEACLPFVPTSSANLSSLASGLALEGEFVGPAWVPTPIESVAGGSPGAGEGEVAATSDCSCLAAQLASEQSQLQTLVNAPAAAPSGFSAQDIELIRRLQANPWSLPQPCHCVECMSMELAVQRLS